MFKIFIEKGEQAGEEFVLREGDNLIGRSSEVQVKLRSSDVSGKQARIFIEGRKVVISNISQHGTWVEGRKLEGVDSVQLEVGQKIVVGRNQSCVLRLTEESPLSRQSAAERSNDVPTEMLPSVVRTQSLSSPAVPKNISKAPETRVESDITPSFGSAVRAPSTQESDYERKMRVKAESVNLEDSTDASGEKTHAQKTVFAPPEEIQARVDEERKKPRQRLLLVLAGIIVVIVLLLLKPSQQPEGKLEWNKTYSEGTIQVPLGGYGLVYPKNETTSNPEVKDNEIRISTGLGRKRDVPLLINLKRYVDPKWAVQESLKSVEDWIKGNPDRIFGRPTLSFEGQQSGVRIWNVSYTGSKPEKIVGRAHLFCHGPRLEVLSVEIPAADQSRAENFLDGYSYFDFPLTYEESHWEGQPPAANLSASILFNQIRDDLRREAPLTWAAIGNQLRMILSQAVAEKRSADEEEALRLLIGLRRQQSFWYNSQQLQMINAKRSGNLKAVAEVAQRCQAVFSDTVDHRYFEVRTW